MRNDSNSKPGDILIACHDPDYGGALTHFLEPYGYQVERCHDARGVLRLSSRNAFDVVVLDLSLDDEGDIDLVSFVLQKNPDTHLLLLFEVVNLERALEGIRKGAFFYLPTSSPPSDVALAIDKSSRTRTATSAIEAYEQTIFQELAGQSAGMQRVIELIQKVAPTDSTVLLLGESGTGKEVLANTIHRLSRRRDEPFIAVNCAALPEALLESEMFGHVKGAFTGADRDKVGLFEEAHSGTVFLDEIGDMAPITQAKLLRVLQNGEVRPVGASQSRKVDVRVVAATNRDLVEAVQNHNFREDLYFRLNVIQIRIPPLRERLDALPNLVEHFLHRANQRYGRNVQTMDEHASSLLRNYDFPGNVRELESIIAHAVILAEGNAIRASDLPESVQHGSTPRLALPAGDMSSVRPLEEVEADCIRNALEQLDGNQTVAAKKLGISRSTLWRKMRQYGLNG